jgi:hypothetical protein
VTTATPTGVDQPTERRASLWLPLLRRLTEVVPRWVVLKSSGEGLGGVGDIDSFAPPEDWPTIEREFRAWALEQGLTFVLVCRHIWRGPHFVAIDPASPYLLVLDVKSYRTFRGSTYARVADAERFAELDMLGFRRVRPGAEGVLKLLWNGMARGGRRHDQGLRTKGVLELLRRDPSGADDAARIVGPAAPLLRRAVREAAAGRWSRPALVAVELWCLIRGLRRPDIIIRQAWFRVRLAKQCPLMSLTRRARRRLPDDRAQWLAAAAAAHDGTSFLADERAGGSIGA